MNARHYLGASVGALSAVGTALAQVDFGAFELLNIGESSEVFAVSADGSAAVGQSDTSGPREAVIWSFNGSPRQIPALAADSRGLGVSSDGSVVVGVSGDEAFYEAPGLGTIGLGDFAGGLFLSAANGVSGDGSVVVGFGTTEVGRQAFRWTQTTGLVSLGDLPGGTENSSAFGISTDGNVIVGFSVSSNGPEAFRWTAQSGLVGLGDLPGGIFSSAANAASADGSIIVGTGSTDNGFEAFRWEASTGLISLGTLPGGFSSIAIAVSADGAVIVGISDDATGREAVRWTELGGIQSIEALLADNGISLGSWQLTDARGVSGDGSVIVGNGINPDGFNRAWFARLGVGFITPSVISSSLQSVAAVPYSIQRTALADVDNALQSARAYGRAGVQRESGAVGVWGVYHGDWHDAVADRRYGSSGAVGIDYQLSDDLKFGAGGRWGEQDGDLSAFDGSFRSTAWGVKAFAAFEPEASGPRLYFGAAVDRFNNDITRGYLNGVTPDASEGEQVGVAYGAALTAGWRLGSGRLYVMPFADYQVTRISLNEYQETSGAFPVRFDAIKDTTHNTRLGLEGNASASDGLKLWATAAWGHHFDNRAPDVSGIIVPLSSRVSVAGVGVVDEWAEGRAGISWSPLARSFVELSGRISNGGIAGNGDRLEGGVSLRISTTFN